MSSVPKATEVAIDRLILDITSILMKPNITPPTSPMRERTLPPPPHKKQKTELHIADVAAGSFDFDEEDQEWNKNANQYALGPDTCALGGSGHTFSPDNSLFTCRDMYCTCEGLTHKLGRSCFGVEEALQKYYDEEQKLHIVEARKVIDKTLVVKAIFVYDESSKNAELSVFLRWEIPAKNIAYDVIKLEHANIEAVTFVATFELDKDPLLKCMEAKELTNGMKARWSSTLPEDKRLYYEKLYLHDVCNRYVLACPMCINVTNVLCELYHNIPLGSQTTDVDITPLGLLKITVDHTVHKGSSKKLRELYEGCSQCQCGNNLHMYRWSELIGMAHGRGLPARIL